MTDKTIPKIEILSVLVAMLCLVLCYVPVQGQMFHARLHTGTMYYQGDLAPRPLSISFGPGNLSWGVSTGYNVTQWASINTRFMIGRLAGDDSFAVPLPKNQYASSTPRPGPGLASRRKNIDLPNSCAC